MGITGENVAEKYGITREEQDEFAVNSHRKAIAAWKECRFKSQIVPVELPARKKGEAPVLFEKDESPREDTTIESLRALKPAFKKDGTVTAGNAPGVNDGAAAVVVTSASAGEGTGRAAHGSNRGAGDQRRRTQMGDDGSGRRGAENLGENGLEERTTLISTNSTKLSRCRRWA